MSVRYQWTKEELLRVGFVAEGRGGHGKYRGYHVWFASRGTLLTLLAGGNTFVGGVAGVRIGGKMPDKCRTQELRAVLEDLVPGFCSKMFTKGNLLLAEAPTETPEDVARLLDALISACDSAKIDIMVDA
jgi:hypothetical protein